MPDHFIPQDTIFDPIEEIEMTGEIKFNLDYLRSKKDFTEQINMSIDNSDSLNFNSIIKKDLNNLTQFILEFHNTYNLRLILCNNQSCLS
jgi:3-deoxy-D-manno-octulosonic-acid transferase